MISKLDKKLDDLLSLPCESEVVEFKEAGSNFDFHKLGKYFSALCNEANLKNTSSAWLVFGVNDRQQIVGTKFRQSPKDLDRADSNPKCNTHRFNE